MIARLVDVLGASPVKPHPIALAKVPASVVWSLEPYADTDGIVWIPAVRRLESRWRGLRPAWFDVVPDKPACSWVRADGKVVPRYPELIVRDLLAHAGWGAVWVKNFGGRGFWTDLDRSGPTIGELPRGPADLIARIDAAAMASLAADGGRPRHPPGGCWDGFAWRRGPRYLFLETKKARESFNENQERWLACALSEGVPFEAFGVVEYAVQP